MTLRIAINGFGRIGRIALRQIFATGREKDLQVVAINDLTDPASLAHLFKYDSVHRTFNGQVSTSAKGITINNQEIQVTREKDPAKLPWKELKVDLVLECTGIFRSKEQASLHISAGAKKVIVSAPSPDPDVTVAFGVNSDAYKPNEHNIISCASCTTNCLAPVAKVLLENFGIKSGTMTTIHSYTNDQQILDLPHKDLRRARAAGLSMIPTSTGAAQAVGLVLPALKGKVDGFSVRVPTPNVSLTDFVALLEKDVTVDEVNRALKNASENSLKNIMEFSDEELVSVDYIGSPASATIDAKCTMVIDKRLVKVVAWYDNEVGFSTRMLDMCQLIAKNL